MSLPTSLLNHRPVLGVKSEVGPTYIMMIVYIDSKFLDEMVTE